jgi:tetratricopeptide (TPR) repeat protein
VGIAYALSDIAIIYTKQKKLNKALKYFEKALTINQKTGDKYGMVNNYDGLTSYYETTEQYDIALEYAKKHLKLATEIGHLQQIIEAYKNMGEIYEKTGKYQFALEQHKLFKIYSDSLINSETEKKTAQLEAEYEYDKKTTQLKTNQAQKNILHQQEIKQQTRISWFIFMAFMILFILVIWVFISRKKLQLAYKNLAIAHTEIEEKSVALAQSNQAIKLKKNEIELLNEKLEQKVKDRTQTLEDANEKLRKYAFSNSHTVRRPLANILGLIEVIHIYGLQHPDSQKYINMLQKSAEELDKVIHDINHNLENFED